MNYLDIKNLDTFSNLGSTDSVLLNKEDNSNFAGSITGDSLRKSLGVYGGIFNVTTCIPLSAGQLYTAETAKAAVPIEPQVRQPGLTVKYKATAGWIQETFIGNDINTWTDPANWITLESISTDISELDGRLTTAETRITQNANAIATKASVTSIDLLTNRMSLAESNITQTANDIATKVSTSTYTTDMNGVTTRLTTAESNITQNATNINLKVSKGDIISQINQSAEAITISASKIDLNGTVTFIALDTNTQNKINTAQTSANTANTNLSTLSSSLGALAYEDQVTLAKLDSTIIQGGYIKTTLIDASSIMSQTFVAKDVSNNMIASMNIEGRGEYVQYYSSGKKRMTFDSGYIRYYNDDVNNTLAWELGSSGAIVTSTLDTWNELYMVPMYTGVDILTPNALQGTKFLVFRPGSGSSYSSYRGLTVIGTVPTNTLPTAITPSQSIPGTDYTTMDYAMPGAAMIWATQGVTQDSDNIYRRVMHTYVGGYRTNTFYVYFNADGNATNAEGNLI